jgi:putative GTP pyrophosphokinase
VPLSTAPDRADFDALLPSLQRLGDLMTEAISAQVDTQELHLAVPLETRVKTWDSVVGKLERGVRGITNFRDFQDLVGIRIVVPFTKDVLHARRVVGAACHVLESYDTSDRLSDDRFGYLASHFVVRLRPTSETASEFRTLTAEVQIRTAAQHVWAQASHTLQYKSAEATPPELRRSVHRIAALLELVDLEFDRLLTAREAYRRSVQMEDDTLQLDVDVLGVALPQLWPAEHPSSPEVYGMLLDSLQRHGISTLGALRQLVATQRSAVFADSLRQTREIIQAVTYGTRKGDTYTIVEGNSSRSHVSVTPEIIERARRGVFYTLSGLTFTALQFAFGERSPPPGTKTPFDSPAG